MLMFEQSNLNQKSIEHLCPKENLKNFNSLLEKNILPLHLETKVFLKEKKC